MTKVMIEIDPIFQANKAKMKIPKKIPKIPGSKILENSVPENPGIWQNPVPKNPGIEILDPARAWS